MIHCEQIESTHTKQEKTTMLLLVSFTKGKKDYIVRCNSVTQSGRNVFLYFSKDMTYIKNAKITNVNPVDLQPFVSDEVKALFAVSCEVS